MTFMSPGGWTQILPLLPALRASHFLLPHPLHEDVENN